MIYILSICLRYYNAQCIGLKARDKVRLSELHSGRFTKYDYNWIYFNSFQLVNRNVNPVILKNGDGKNSLFVIQGTIIFPQSRLSSHTEKKFPCSRLRRSQGNFSSVFLLTLSWGNIIVPFMTHREFLFPSLAASPLVKEISRPHFLKWWDWANSSKFSMPNSNDRYQNMCLFCFF